MREEISWLILSGHYMLMEIAPQHAPALGKLSLEQTEELMSQIARNHGILETKTVINRYIKDKISKDEC
jgi:hypothetical protein